MLDVKFIFPPFNSTRVFLHSPHLACGLLSSICNQQNLKAKSFDLNAFFSKLVLSPALIEKISQENQELKNIYDEIKTTNSDGKRFEFIKNFYNQNFIEPSTVKACCFFEQNSVSPLFETILKIAVKEMIKEDTKSIAISCAFSEQLFFSVLIAKMIKELSSEIKVYLGGSQINLLAPSQIESLRKTHLFDSIILGNGEEQISQTINYLNNKRGFELIKLEKVSKKTFNNLPFIKFDNLDYYFKPLSIPLLVGKGCHWGKCSFCDYKNLFESKHFILKKTSTLSQEIYQYNKEHEIISFVLSSDSIPKKWLVDLCKKTASFGLKLPFSCYMLHDKSLDKKFFSFLSQNAKPSITFGTESTNDRILKTMGKKANFETIKKNLIASFENNIYTNVNIIPDFPTTSFDEAMGVLRDLENIKKYIYQLNVQFFDLTYNTDIYHNPKKYGLTIDKKNFYKRAHGYHGVNILSRSDLTEKQQRIIRKRFLELEADINNK